jgi:lipopolysaccharide transport system ATP-binding protein
MSVPVIQVVHLGKRYRIGAAFRRATARDAIANAAGRLVDRLRSGRPSAPAFEDLWAVDDVSFDVHAGDRVGIIGRNGAGKSTLLKILSQITEPTSGYVDIAGRVGSLLEVGTGFHADLTGRENTYLNGAILGMKRAEIDRKFDEIVAFAEIERFIDTPVKFYSSGMYMRLAFAVAAHLDTEILVVDEVLAVGDSRFQQKCLGKMDDIARHGRTVLFVSHNMDAILRMCSRGVLLDRGRLVASGPMDEVVARYRDVERTMADIGRFNSRGRSGTGWARVTDVRLVDDAGRRISERPAEADLVFEVDLALTDPDRFGASLRGLILEIVVCSDQGQPLICVMNVDDDGVELPAARACTVRARLAGPTFIPGRYRVNLFLGIPSLEHVDEIPDALEFDVSLPLQPWRPYQLHANRQLVCRKAEWSCSVTEPQGVEARV